MYTRRTAWESILDVNGDQKRNDVQFIVFLCKDVWEEGAPDCSVYTCTYLAIVCAMSLFQNGSQYPEMGGSVDDSHKTFGHNGSLFYVPIAVEAIKGETVMWTWLIMVDAINLAKPLFPMRWRTYAATVAISLSFRGGRMCFMICPSITSSPNVCVFSRQIWTSVTHTNNMEWSHAQEWRTPMMV